MPDSDGIRDREIELDKFEKEMKTKDGYLKDGFVVSDEDEDEEEEEFVSSNEDEEQDDDEQLDEGDELIEESYDYDSESDKKK